MIDVAKELTQIERYNIKNFSAEELLRATNYFDVHQIIHDEGSYKIYKGSLEERLILVKKFAESICDREITLQMSSHKNIARLFGCCLELEGPALVYEYSEDEPLNNFLYDRDRASSGPHEDRSLKWENRLWIAEDIADAVVYLHTTLSGPIVNRDLKPSNIMVDQDGFAKLFDISSSISIPLGESGVLEDIAMGSLVFIDPEYIESGFVTEKSDVYGFGVLLLVLLTGQAALDFNRKDERDVVKYVKKYVDEDQFTKIVDPRILEEGGGIEQEQQLQAFLALSLRCVELKGEDRPEMINVAKELRQIERLVEW